MSQPIGIFDSGVGGLTVMAAIRKRLPAESLLYLGDTARVPYGTKSAETILRYTEESLTFLARKNVKAIVIACNSASAHALPYLQTKFHLPLVGVIEAGVEAAASATRNKKIGVIGTEATIASEIYPKRLRAIDPAFEIQSAACPLFVPLAEEGWIDHPVAELVAKEYLAGLASDGLDTLILGCTHYPLFKELLAKVLGPQITLIDSAAAVADQLADILDRENLSAVAGAPARIELFVTDFPRRFAALAKRFLGEEPPPIRRVSL